MKVRYSKIRGVRMVISGTVLTVLYLFLLSRGHGNPLLLAPCLLILISGILYLNRPYFELRENELVIFSLTGHVMKRYAFSSLADFEVVGFRIYVVNDEKRKRVRITRWIALRQDWERFMDRITGNELTRELHNI